MLKPLSLAKPVGTIKVKMYQALQSRKVSGFYLQKRSSDSPEFNTQNFKSFSRSDNTTAVFVIECLPIEDLFKFTIASYSVNRVKKRIISSQPSKSGLGKLSIFKRTSEAKLKSLMADELIQSQFLWIYLHQSILIASFLEYIAIFTYMVTHAVRIKLVEDYTSEAFITALHGLTYHRGYHAKVFIFRYSR